MACYCQQPDCQRVTVLFHSMTVVQSYCLHCVVMAASTHETLLVTATCCCAAGGAAGRLLSGSVQVGSPVKSLIRLSPIAPGAK
jgi:hypothetical protein